MIPYSATLGYATLLDRLSAAALADLDRLLRAVQDEPIEIQREALMDLLPELGDEYVGASSLVSAQFFDEIQSMMMVSKPVEPQVITSASRARWHALAGWGARGSVIEQGGTMLMYSLLSGGLTKTLTELAADTMIGNAELLNGAQSEFYVGYQRVPRPGCCAFCGMLASRGAAYSSEESAGKVVGRGRPVGSHKLAKGINPRGSQRAGEKFHDHCRCSVVAVSESMYAEMQADADRYYEAYKAARGEATGKLEWNTTEWMAPDGTRHHVSEWVDEQGDTFKADNRLTKRIVAEMRDSLGVK